MSNSPGYSEDDDVPVGTGVEDFRGSSARRRLLDDDVTGRRNVQSSASMEALQPQSSDSFAPPIGNVLTRKLRAEATKEFEQSAAVVNKLEAMCESEDAFRKIDISLTVERKMDMYKNLLETRGKDAFFDVLMGELQCGVRISKTNELLSKSNAELTEQLSFAREIACRKQSEAVEKLKGIVSKALSMSDEKESEAVDWKSKHDLFAAQHERNKTEMRNVRAKLEEAHSIQEQLSKEQGILRNNIDGKNLEIEEKDKKLAELEKKVIAYGAKIRDLESDIQKRTEEVVELDADLRKKREIVERVNEKYRTEMKRTLDEVEKEANVHLEKAEKTLRERHEADRRELVAQLQHALNEKDLAQRTAGKHENTIEELQEKIRDLENELRHSERTARAKYIRQVLTATVKADNTTDSDSSEALQPIGNRPRTHVHPSVRSAGVGTSKRVGFQEAPGTRNSPKKKLPR